jgi:hypothetical protein
LWKYYQYIAACLPTSAWIAAQVTDSLVTKAKAKNIACLKLLRVYSNQVSLVGLTVSTSLEYIKQVTFNYIK